MIANLIFPIYIYIDPPGKAIVLCVDEKPSIQALERAQGYLKLPTGRAPLGRREAFRRACRSSEALENRRPSIRQQGSGGASKDQRYDCYYRDAETHNRDCEGVICG